MFKRLTVLLVLLVSISYSQGPVLGPFMLLESIDEARAKCKSLTFVKSGFNEEYVADIGDEFKWELHFDDNKLQSIMMISRPGATRPDYIDVVDKFSGIIGRRPGNSSAMGDGYLSWWRNEYVEFQVIYNAKTQLLTLFLYPNYN